MNNRTTTSHRTTLTLLVLALVCCFCGLSSAQQQDERCATVELKAGDSCDSVAHHKLECESNFLWDGCEQPLRCLPSTICSCRFGSWTCLQKAQIQCEGDSPAMRNRPCSEADRTNNDESGNTIIDSADVEDQVEATVLQGGQATPVSFYGLNYNTRKGPDWAADRERCKSRAEVVRDLELLSRITTRIRVLSLVDCGQGALVWSILSDELASAQMEVWLGLWVGVDPQDFIDEYDALASFLPDILASDNWKSKLTGISVGSEAIYREDVTVEEAIANLDSTRALLDAYGVGGEISVAIVDIAPVYSNNQDLRLASDTIMTNTFPFWEGLPVGAATDELEIDLGWLVDLPESKGKPFVLSEHGWPSAGFLDDVGVASTENQQQYLEESFCYLKQKGWANYWFTAIDNDWRQEQDPNNTIEGNWGFLKADLGLKDHFDSFSFRCDFDGSSHTFAGIDWTPRVLQEEPIDPATTSCQLWTGCQELSGSCCPTAGGDFLACCRQENFLGELETNQADTTPAELAPSEPSCNFCEGQKYFQEPVIRFSTGNDSVSCGGLTDLIRSGLSPTFCESERLAIEETCCGPIPETPSPTAPLIVIPPAPTPTQDPTANPTQFPTRGGRGRRTPSPTEFPTTTPTVAPSNSPTRSPTNPPTRPPTRSPTRSPEEGEEESESTEEEESTEAVEEEETAEAVEEEETAEDAPFLDPVQETEEAVIDEEEPIADLSGIFPDDIGADTAISKIGNESGAGFLWYHHTIAAKLCIAAVVGSLAFLV